MAKIEVINYPLYQWDKGRKIRIILEGNESLERIDFANYNGKEAPSVFVDPDNNNEVLCKIPDELLQKNGGLKIYAVTTKEETRTFCEATFTVIRKLKPTDYISEKSEILSFKDLDNKIGSLMQLETEEKGDVVKAINEISQTLKTFVSIELQDFTNEQQKQARKNIGIDIEPMDAIELAAETGLVEPAASDDCIFTDENGDIYTL